jgi:hypothetical protein
MTATLTRPAWTTDYEIEIFNRLISEYAPYLPLTKQYEPRPPKNKAEWETFYQYRIAGAAHDLFIVQITAKAIAQLFLENTVENADVQLFLSRQIGDDGAHSQDTRQRVKDLSGHDPVEAINQQVQRHWDYIGDLPLRNWLGFIAYELHYELHIVAILLLTSRLTRISEPQSSAYAVERILPDEAVHRLGVVEWWQRRYDQASAEERKAWATQLLKLDNELQLLRNPYLRDFWQRAQRALGFEVEGFDVIYDVWRRQVLSYLLEIPGDRLPKLVSIND